MVREHKDQVLLKQKVDLTSDLAVHFGRVFFGRVEKLSFCNFARQVYQDNELKP